MSTEVIVAAITVTGGLLGTIATILYNKDKERIDTQLRAMQFIIDTLQEEIASLKKERNDCEQKIHTLQEELLTQKRDGDAMRVEIDALRAGIATLIQQLTQAGIKPEWIPGTGQLTRTVPQRRQL